MRLRSSANSAQSYAEAEALQGRATGQGIDPLLVAAFTMDDPYVVAIRSIRSSIVQRYEDVSRDTRYCALIGLDCNEALAVMAANLAVVTTHMGSSTLVVDTNHAHPRVAELFGCSDSPVVQSTPLVGLTVIGTGRGEGGVADPVERRPLIEQRDEWNARVDQVIVAIALNEAHSAASIANALHGFDAAVIVARKNVTQGRPTRALIDVLDQHRVPIVGTVLV